MKKILTGLALFAVISGCSFFSTMSAVEYNNAVVGKINEISAQIEKAADTYNEVVPTIVRENTEINTELMESELESAQDLFAQVDGLSSLKSKNLEQQNAVAEALKSYKSTAETFFTDYEKMLTYYKDGTYKTDVSQVTAMDESIHADYSAFIESNNALVSTLDLYVDSN
ncbi:hypothetical protein HY463_00430 [Candidatus Peregrinibacteria bacterium]|nr:hypothetical protein [Candidatus Peregrinibacteria bacterium]